MAIDAATIRLAGYLTPEQAAAYTGFSVSYLEKLRAESRGPAHSCVGKRKGIRYKVNDLDAWMDSFKVHTHDSVSLA